MHTRKFIEDQPKGVVPVRVSAKSVRLLFEGCSSSFIRGVCKGACCCLKSLLSGPVIKVEEDQRKPLAKLGAKFDDGVMRTVNARCLFHDGCAGFCSVHLLGIKPRSCIQSPFTLNDNDTLIVRNRYKLLCCYRVEGAVPVYVAFRASLDLLFGGHEAERICIHMQGGGRDLIAYMLEGCYQFNKEVTSTWRIGGSK